MKEFYGYFYGTESDPREYVDLEFAEVIKTLATDGVAHSGDCLKAHEVIGSMSVRISYGNALLNGRLYALKDDGGSVLTRDIATSASSTRIDRVVVRLNLATGARNIGIFVLTGTPAAEPTPPALTRQGEIYEISLAQVRVEPGATSITQSMIIDERVDEAVCGIIQLKRSELPDVHRHANATTVKDGFMAKEDKAKLDSSISQGLKPTDSPTFAGLVLNGNLGVTGTVTVNGVIQGARFE